MRLPVLLTQISVWVRAAQITSIIVIAAALIDGRVQWRWMSVSGMLWQLLALLILELTLRFAHASAHPTPENPSLTPA